MIDAKNKDGKISIPIKLIGRTIIVSDFFIDTGFDGYLKIDKKLFDDLELEKTAEDREISFANNSNELANIARVKFEVDEAKGESEVLAVGWGGRNLVGQKFLKAAGIILIFDPMFDGMYLSNNRNIAYEIGKTIATFHKE